MAQELMSLRRMYDAELENWVTSVSGVESWAFQASVGRFQSNQSRAGAIHRGYSVTKTG
jgi:hypothetical protein